MYLSGAGLKLGISLQQALWIQKRAAQLSLAYRQPRKMCLRRRSSHNCANKQSDAGSVSWLDSESPPVRTDYDAVIVLAGTCKSLTASSCTAIIAQPAGLKAHDFAIQRRQCVLTWLVETLPWPSEWLFMRCCEEWRYSVGGLTPNGGLPEWVTRRLDAGADIQRQQGNLPPPHNLPEMPFLRFFTH